MSRMAPCLNVVAGFFLTRAALESRSHVSRRLAAADQAEGLECSEDRLVPRKFSRIRRLRMGDVASQAAGGATTMQWLFAREKPT